MTLSTTLNSRTMTRTQHSLSQATVQGIKMLELPLQSIESYLIDLSHENIFIDFDKVKITEYERNERSSNPKSHSYTTSCSFNSRNTTQEQTNLLDMISTTSKTERLNRYLRLQVASLHLDPSTQGIVIKLIEHLDNDGYFSYELNAFCDSLGIDVDQGTRALQIIQSLDPKGVAARDLAECLLLQIPDTHPDKNLLSEAVTCHLDDIAAHRHSRIKRSLHVDNEGLCRIIKEIKSLDPFPGSDFSHSGQTCYLAPDLIVKQMERDLILEVPGENYSKLVFDACYIEMLNTPSLQKEAQEYLEKKYTEASRIIDSLERRCESLFLLGTYLLKTQQSFFTTGSHCIKPATMADAAEQIGLSVSAISRIVKDKYISTPHGLFPLRYFFSSSISCRNTSQGEISSHALENMIEHIIQNESPSGSLSDQDISIELLKNHGIELSRRSITNYRKKLGIESQIKRRSLTTNYVGTKVKHGIPR